MLEENTLNSNGFYGQLGVLSLSNISRAHDSVASSYNKNSGTLWLFGGLNGMIDDEN
jgi:hypothetical protein